MDMLGALQRGSQNIESLSKPSILRQRAREVASIGNAHRATYLVAASSAAERLVGAALMLAGDHDPTGCDDHIILIVDINCASGTALSRAARQARASGATQVIAVVLDLLTSTPADIRTLDVDDLIVLDRNGCSGAGSPI